MFISNDYSLSVFGALAIIVLFYLKDKKEKKNIDLKDYLVKLIIISLGIYIVLFIKDKYLLTESHYAKNVSIDDPNF